MASETHPVSSPSAHPVCYSVTEQVGPAAAPWTCPFRSSPFLHTQSHRLSVLPSTARSCRGVRALDVRLKGLRRSLPLPARSGSSRASGASVSGCRPDSPPRQLRAAALLAPPDRAGRQRPASLLEGPPRTPLESGRTPTRSHRTPFPATHPACPHCAGSASGRPAAARLGGRPRGGRSGAATWPRYRRVRMRP